MVEKQEAKNKRFRGRSHKKRKGEMKERKHNIADRDTESHKKMTKQKLLDYLWALKDQNSAGNKKPQKRAGRIAWHGRVSLSQWFQAGNLSFV